MPYPNEHACRIKSPGLFQEGSFRRMNKTSDGKSFTIIVGRLKGQTTTTSQALRYPKKSWTAEQARKHCKEHGGIKFEPAIKEKTT